MRKVFHLLFVLLLSSCIGPQIKNDAKIEFEEKSFDFGKLKYKQDASCQFEFSNPGESYLVIHDVKTSCGCTVPEWNKKPLKSGEKGTLKIDYDTSHPGRFHKTITVFYNGTDAPVKLTVKGSVEFPENMEI